MSYPSFITGEILTAADMNAVGLWLVKTVTVGAGVTSVPVTDAFSADYDNYRITYTGGVGSASASLQMRLGSTITGYYNQLIYATYAAPTPPIANVPDNNGTQWSFVGANNTTMPRIEMQITNPFSSYRTGMNGSYVDTGIGGHFAGYLNDTTSYTGFTIFAGSSTTLTGGIIRVYG